MPEPACRPVLVSRFSVVGATGHRQPATGHRQPATGNRPSWSRAQLARGGAVVDREKRVIRGCALLTRGEALGHGFWLDSEFVAETVKSGLAAGDRGVKARFTHPGLCSDGLGKYLGRWRSFRREGDVARADLHLAESASRSPDGDLAGYVMDLAEEDPAAFGASIVFEHDVEAELAFLDEHKQYDEEAGRKLFKSPDPDNLEHLKHARLAGLRTADVVDDPASNPDGLFGRGQDLAGRAEKFLDWLLAGEGPAPEVEPAFGVSAERAREFFTAYLDRRNVRLSSALATPGASATEEPMAEETGKVTPEKVTALQAEAKAAGIDEGKKAVREDLAAMLAAFPKDRPFALESFATGLSLEAARKAAADKLAVKVEQLEKENAELKAQTTPPPPPAGAAAGFAEGAAGAGDFMSAVRALAAEKHLGLDQAMSQVVREQPELHARFLAGAK